ncbi:transposase [Streptomyces sp. NPDC058272]|uniref:transposase n=1 Tax=Streptomyces sp. NPDC058272 TaxID=3346415 RepID=UPI0036F00F9E
MLRLPTPIYRYPSPDPRTQVPGRRMREQFNGILWRSRTGSGWRDVPERYGSWSTLYDRFNAWSKAGVFQGLMDTLIAEAASRGQVGLELVSVDSTIVRAHHESAGLAIAGETLDEERRELERQRGIAARPPAPDWLIERGLSGQDLMSVHTGDARSGPQGHPRRPVPGGGSGRVGRGHE